jgi:hypothetical protein
MLSKDSWSCAKGTYEVDSELEMEVYNCTRQMWERKESNSSS